MKINFYKTLINLYSFLFIFTMINREFLFFGIDLRFIVLLVGLALIVFSYSLKKDERKIPKDSKKIYILLLLFFFWSLLSNISWVWNGLERFPKETINQNILLVNNLIAIIVFKKYYFHLDEEKIKKFVVFSCVILVLSFILTGKGYTLSQISGSNVRSMVQVSVGAEEHKNIFGGGYRLAGYAEDPNYASVFLVLGAITSLQLNCKKWEKLGFVGIFLLAFGFSCSKTIILSFVLGLMYLLCISFFKKNGFPKVINVTFSVCMAILIIYLPASNFLSSHTTMTTRFKMWNMAKDLFLANPLIGNGINAFKSYINSQYNGLWYVQCHSTYWQILSEMGALGFIIFIRLMISCLNNNNLTKYNKYLLFIFLVFIINFETIQLQIFVYIIFVLSLFDAKKQEV